MRHYENNRIVYNKIWIGLAMVYIYILIYIYIYIYIYINIYIDILIYIYITYIYILYICDSINEKRSSGPHWLRDAMMATSWYQILSCNKNTSDMGLFEQDILIIWLIRS